MEFLSKKVGDVLVVKPLMERIDASVSMQFKAAVLDMINGESRKMVLDLSEIDFIDSSGLGALIAIWKALSHTQGRLVLCGVSVLVMNLFTLTRMDKVLPIFAGEKEAIQALNIPQ